MSEQTGLLAGFAKIDITPDYPVGLGGFSDPETRLSEGVAEKIYATCIALTEGEETILVYTIDNCGCPSETADRFRDVVSKAVKIDGEKMFFAATHSHNAPSRFGHPAAEMYNCQMSVACARAAQLALDDRAPAKVMATTKKVPGMNYTRHVLLENGIVAGGNWKSYNSPVKEFFGPTDDQLVLVSFRREEKKDILLINWQGHPCNATQIGYNTIAPCYVGPLRDTVAVGSGMEVAYFTGADGNLIIDCKNFFPEKAHYLSWRRYGAKMGAIVLEALDELKEIEGSGIATRRRIVEVDVDHSWDDKVPQAKEIFDLWKSTDLATGTAACKKYDFSSVYQARSILSRAKMEKSVEVEINAFRVGGVGFTTGEYEMFAESGIQVKEGSPYEVTFLLTGNAGYIPSKRNYAFRCYEADTGLYAEGVAEELVRHYVEMLKEMQ